MPAVQDIALCYQHCGIKCGSDGDCLVSCLEKCRKTSTLFKFLIQRMIHVLSVKLCDQGIKQNKKLITDIEKPKIYLQKMNQ